MAGTYGLGAPPGPSFILRAIDQKEAL